MNEIALLARHPDASTFCGKDAQYGSEILVTALKSPRLLVYKFLGRYDRPVESYGMPSAVDPIIATAADPMKITLLRISGHRMIRSTRESHHLKAVRNGYLLRVTLPPLILYRLRYSRFRSGPGVLQYFFPLLYVGPKPTTQCTKPSRPRQTNGTARRVDVLRLIPVDTTLARGIQVVGLLTNPTPLVGNESPTHVNTTDERS